MVQTNTIRCFPVSQTCSHLGTSPQVTVYSAWIFAEHIQLWNQNSFSFGAWSQGGVDYIVSPFHSTVTGVVVRGLRSSSVIWSSYADLSGSGPHKLIALSLIH